MAVTNCLLVTQRWVNKPLQLTQETGEGKRRGKPSTGSGGYVRGAIVRFVVFLLFTSIHTADFVEDV